MSVAWQEHDPEPVRARKAVSFLTRIRREAPELWEQIKGFAMKEKSDEHSAASGTASTDQSELRA